MAVVRERDKIRTGDECGRGHKFNKTIVSGSRWCDWGVHPLLSLLDVFGTSRRPCPSPSRFPMTPAHSQLLLIPLPHSTHPLPPVPHMTPSDPRPNVVYHSVCSNLPNSGFHMTWVDPCRPRCPRSFPFCFLHVLDARFFSQFARLVRSSSSTSSKSARTGRTSVRPSIAFETCPPVESPLTSLLPAPTQSTHGSRALASDYENEPHPALSHNSVDLDHHDMSPLFADPPPESLSRRAKVSLFVLFTTFRSPTLLPQVLWLSFTVLVAFPIPLQGRRPPFRLCFK